MKPRRIASNARPTARKRPRPKGDHEAAVHLAAILETAVEGIITIDDRGRIESMNPAAENLFGWKASELIGDNVSRLMPSPYREAHEGFIANYLRTGRAKVIGVGREVVGQRRDGTTFPMDLSISEVNLPGRRFFTGFVRDLTERRRLESLVLEIGEQERRRIGQDLHDGICQQLAGISLVAQSLEERLRREKSPVADQIARCREEILSIINETRRLARGLCPVVLESGGLMAALDHLADASDRHGVHRCRFHCRRAFSVDDNAAATHLYRIAQEAVNNALKHGRAPAVDIFLAHDDATLTLTIRDNGSGLRPGRRSGGMGLDIMRHRARILGGGIRLEKTRGGGVTVVCSVPCPPLHPNAL